MQSALRLVSVTFRAAASSDATMQNLVNYDSSSDEDDASLASASVPQSTARETNTGLPALNGTAGPRAALDGGVEINARPVVGPIMRETATEGSQEAGSEPDELPERDLIRHLTQASHPMTSIPASPTGSPTPAIEAKFKRFLELKSKGLHFNEDLVKKSSFQNPALFDNMMSKIGLDSDAQYATNMPSNVFDPKTLPAHGYKEELLRRQQSIRDSENARKKQASAAGKRTIDFAPANVYETESQRTNS